MKRRIRNATIPIVVALLGAACTGGGAPKPTPSSSASPPRRGGTLRVGMINDQGACGFSFCGPEVSDPQMNGYLPPNFEVYRCCLVRTLLSFKGLPTGEGGALPEPDLAAALPTVSADGLTWTFLLKPGLHYAPPLANTQIVAQDFIRSIDRLFSPRPAWIPEPWGDFIGGYSGGYLDLIDIIAGARDYQEGKSSTISGLEAPNPTTLVVHLTRPTGDFAYRLAQPDFGPIPADPSDPSAPFGIAEGHARYFMTFVVATGPYMIEGADKLDFSKPSDMMLPPPLGGPPGDRPSSLTLVRNPSWDPRSDDLRLALPDRIVFTRVADEQEAARLVQSGALDLVLNWDAAPAVTASSGTRAFTTAADAVLLVELNLGVPPLDDLHVRRAINFAVARQPQVAALTRAGIGATVETHIGLDSEENNLLLNFDPYEAVNGDVAKARAEMMQSAYDTNHDGLCDAPACGKLRLLVRDDEPGQTEMARAIAADLRSIGIVVKVVPQDRDTFNSTWGPESHTPMRIYEWLKDLTSAATYFPPLFGSPATGVTQSYSPSLVGATDQKLRQWGYKARSTPNVDGRMEACLPLTFASQLQCWAGLDQYMMTEVVPWIPLISLTTSRVVSSRIASLSFDQAPSTPQPSLDRIALPAGSDAGLPPVGTAPSSVPAIPNGIYRLAISKQDLFRFDPNYDPGSVDENTGTVTILIEDGQWESVQFADHQVYRPLNVGTYHGSSDRVVFETVAPPDNAIATPEMSWSFDGTALQFKFLNCGNLNTLDPEAPHLCDDIRILYEAHPWVKIG